MDVYTLAHEVKNPLCVSKGYLEMLNDKNIDKYKGIIEKEIDDAIGVLNSYLDYKKLVVNNELIDINVLLTDIKKYLKEYLKYYGVKLQVKLIDDDFYIMGDYSKLEQVFRNILRNSMEAFSKNIIIDYKIKNNKIIICIKDDGIGIEKKNIKKVGTNYTTKVLGNGIGVKLSKKIIKLHNGTIKYQNNIDKGVSVYITLLLK